MNFKKSALASAITLATFATGAAAFDASSWEVSGFVKNETAALQGSGTFIGQETTSIDTTSHNDGGDVIKFENTAKVFINGDLTDNAALHAELNFVYDAEATPNDYQGHMNYSQNDYLRELYVDTMVGDTEVRVGKQQVVWGTADGIKLLDIINPTDYREFAQNTMEDSRIPVWMIKTDTYVGDTGSLQFVISQSEHNKIVGMTTASGATRLVTDSSGSYSYGDSANNAQILGVDAGNPFMMKGVDTIIGKSNGFFNIGAAMGAVTETFRGGGFTDPDSGNSTYYVPAPPESTTVANFADGFDANSVIGVLGTTIRNQMCGGVGATGADCLKGFTELSNSNITNLYDNAGVNTTPGSSNVGGDYDYANPNSMWEYMPNASFATFNAFVNMGTKYVRNHPDDFDLNLGTRYKTSFDNGLNLSLNYLYAYDPNPVVQIHWENSSGTRLTPVVTESVTTATVKTVHLTDGTNYYGGVATYNGTDINDGSSPEAYNVSTAAPVTLVFNETLERAHNLGAAMDYTLETEALPVVLRGEFLYQKDVMTPIINRTELGYGNMTEALKMQQTDFFKYVIGADINVLTNMMVSGQFIQFRNLDYVSEGSSLSDASWRYSADPTAMHLSNGLKKAEKNKEFYSLFLSKPFGPNQLGRWNNIFIFEEGGGKWNRFDVEYSFSDELVGSFELNNYWGDANTQFGQMEDSSNIQVGLKYLF
jgi:hypothetical protein